MDSEEIIIDQNATQTINAALKDKRRICSSLWYKGFNNPFKFLEKGEYKIIINHAMRKRGKVKGLQLLKGVLDVGFTIENNH